MSRLSRALVAFVVSAPLSLGLAAGSVLIHRQIPMVTGNVCQPTNDNPEGRCYARLPAAGWPFPFLFDDPGTSVRGHLYWNDDFAPGWFLLDAAIFSALAAGLAAILRRRTAWEA